MSEFKYVEVKLRDALGISDSLIKKTRREILEGGHDFQQVEQRVCYTEEAVGKVVQYLRGEKTNAKNRAKAEAVRLTELLLASVREGVLLEKQPVPSTADPLLLTEPWKAPDCTMKFHKCPHNPRILLGRIDDEDWVKEHGQQFYLRFSNNRERTIPGDRYFKDKIFRIRVKDNSNFTKGMEIPCRHIQADLWECTKRMPRGRGRW